MEQKILDFISIFQTPENQDLFSYCACYYFSVILRARFPISSIMYSPDHVHFAVKIGDDLYDIRGIVEDPEYYIDWEEYREENIDADDIILNCIRIERR